MSERGRVYVERWAENEITAHAYQVIEDDDPEAEQHAQRCLAGAAEEEVAADEIEEEVGPLVAYMTTVMRRRAADDRERRLARND